MVAAYNEAVLNLCLDPGIPIVGQISVGYDNNRMVQA